MRNKPEWILSFAALSLGFTSIFSQVYILREFLSVFFGNELVVGIVLAAWLLLTGAGSRLGKLAGRIRNKERFILCLLIVFSILPILAVLSAGLFRYLAVPAGSMVSLNEIIIIAVVALLPFCLVNGFLFTGLTGLFSESRTGNPAGRTYAMESAGSAIGGIIVNVILLWSFDVFTSLRILLILNALLILLFSVTLCKLKDRIISSLIISSLIISSLTIDFRSISLSLLFPAQEVVLDRPTPYGKITVTRSGSQLNYFSNGLLLFSSGNGINNEESVHYAMLQRTSHKKVLLISGGISGTTAEILKYNPDRIDYAELDPALVQIGKTCTRYLVDSRIKVFTGDARRFVRKTEQKYDAVLVNVPEPSTLQINRFFTLEFLQELKRVMNHNGVVSFSLPTTADYVSGSSGNLHSSLYRTLSLAFRQILIIPGQRDYYLASDSPLSGNIAELSSLRGITNEFVNRYYIDDTMIRDRGRYITEHLDPKASVNHDLRPVTFYRQILYWLSYFDTGFLVPAGIALLLITLLAVSITPVNSGLFSGGFTAASIEIQLILAFQVIYGYVFQMLGIIIALFMAGMSAGAFLTRWVYPQTKFPHYIHLQVTMALFSLGFPFVLMAMTLLPVPPGIIYLVFALLTLVISVLTGLEFSVLSLLQSNDPTGSASRNYSTDLIGAAAGALLTSVLLLPLLGLTGACLVLAGLNLVTAMVCYLSGRSGFLFRNFTS